MAPTYNRGHLVLGPAPTVVTQHGGALTIVVAWFLKVTIVGTHDPLNLGCVPIRGGLGS